MNKFMEMAIEEATFGITNGDGGPFGCVIVKNGEVVGKGHNEVIKKKDPTCHGEITAIRNACAKLKTNDLSGCELYTTGQPCPMCLGAILWSNIAKIYYGCSIEDAETIGFRDKEFFESPKKRVSSFVLDREECKKLFDNYQRLSNKKMY